MGWLQSCTQLAHCNRRKVLSAERKEELGKLRRGARTGKPRFACGFLSEK